MIHLACQSSILGVVWFWGTKKNAADLEMYIFSRYLKDTSVIYNWRVLHLVKCSSNLYTFLQVQTPKYVSIM